MSLDGQPMDHPAFKRQPLFQPAKIAQYVGSWHRLYHGCLSNMTYAGVPAPTGCSVTQCSFAGLTDANPDWLQVQQLGTLS